MTYHEIVYRVREDMENADAREIFEHIAVQINIIGEGEGAFYIEVAERHICVEPYDYHDRDGLLIATGDTILRMAEGDITPIEAYEQGLLKVEGNMDKLYALNRVKIKRMQKKKK